MTSILLIKESLTFDEIQISIFEQMVYEGEDFIIDTPDPLKYSGASRSFILPTHTH